MFVCLANWQASRGPGLQTRGIWWWLTLCGRFKIQKLFLQPKQKSTSGLSSKAWKPEGLISAGGCKLTETCRWCQRVSCRWTQSTLAHMYLHFLYDSPAEEIASTGPAAAVPSSFVNPAPAMPTNLVNPAPAVPSSLVNPASAVPSSLVNPAPAVPSSLVNPEPANQPESSELSVDISTVIFDIIEHCQKTDISNNPVEILRYMQRRPVLGKALDVDITQCEGGATSYIVVDRKEILQTDFDEIALVKNRFLSLEVQFYEVCESNVHIYYLCTRVCVCVCEWKLINQMWVESQWYC